MRRRRFFLETEIKTDCDVCGRYFDMIKGGVCETCRRVLCADHLHGSFTRRLWADIVGRNICVDCRRGA